MADLTFGGWKEWVAQQTEAMGLTMGASPTSLMESPPPGQIRRRIRSRSPLRFPPPPAALIAGTPSTTGAPAAATPGAASASTGSAATAAEGALAGVESQIPLGSPVAVVAPGPVSNMFEEADDEEEAAEAEFTDP